jgi:hypothetical protein
MVKPIPVEAFTMTPEQSFEVAKMKAFVSQIHREELESMLISYMEQNIYIKNVVSMVAKGEY